MAAAASALAVNSEQPEWATAVLLLADGAIFWGRGVGAMGARTGEICFNTSITGYQEILTDPSYAGEIITFTFPHIGNVGTNCEDRESLRPRALGCIFAADVTAASNWRSSQSLEDFLKENGLPAICGIDTRQLTIKIRQTGAINGTLAHFGEGRVNLKDLYAKTAAWPGLEGMDLAAEVTTKKTYSWNEPRRILHCDKETLEASANPCHRFKVAVFDFGIKHNILRSLVSLGCETTVVPATTTFEEIEEMGPDGVFLSNGPGDPAATGGYAVPVIRQIMKTGIPIFGICLGHQLLALALGGKTKKMHHGHRGANHPVKDLPTGKVEVTSQNHGFVVDEASLPVHVQKTHVSLFDGTVEGLRVKDRPIFGVQYHPEASPGPEDSGHLFTRFVSMMEARRK